MKAFLVVAANVFAGCKFVNRAAIWALGFTGFGHIHIDLGVAVLQLHVGFGVGTKHTTMTIEVGSFEFNGMAHFDFKLSSTNVRISDCGR